MDFPKEYVELLDMERILNVTKNKNKLKVILKKDTIKGTGLYATKPIKKGDTIAYYKITTFSRNEYTSPTNYVYSFEVYTCAGRESKYLIGDLYLDSIPEPTNNIPYWGLFINEPSENQDVNSEVDMNLDGNYKSEKRKRVKCGGKLIYKVVALRDINVGEEITLNYGDNYVRSYEVAHVTP
ncbi:SET domain-containing protein [Fadolivirus algeromassiliense]|jgi:hypothetical protein|uniref:SET domain-containing protein n=1 Tax=Fadolivirus FV1/VV64 TaxID=3070911 RepID=A0A7D3UUW1_9VIRU|nr:SET domain-containing protein [Fadolivirus algeromassiliense]QKF93769.1 SET domain-containing protein [Fadolivirus FV1/VV64]